MLEKKYNEWVAYMQSKLANVYFTKHMNEELKNSGTTNIKTVSLHPGVVRTDLYRNMHPLFNFAMNTFCYPGYWCLTKDAW